MIATVVVLRTSTITVMLHSPKKHINIIKWLTWKKQVSANVPFSIDRACLISLFLKIRAEELNDLHQNSILDVETSINSTTDRANMTKRKESSSSSFIQYSAFKRVQTDDYEWVHSHISKRDANHWDYWLRDWLSMEAYHLSIKLSLLND